MLLLFVMRCARSSIFLFFFLIFIKAIDEQSSSSLKL
nr:MAG TPA: hypothetical protein [Caudoviricetes sp.]